MITNMGNKYGERGTRADFMGLSTDTKPSTDIDTNSLFLELDTGDLYFFTGADWSKVGG